MGSPTDAEVIVRSISSPSSFGEVFDRHATTIFRYFVRRVGPDQAESLLSDVFRIAFERRATFDTARPEARPWLYGIASNLLAKHRRQEARRLAATARLARTTTATADAFADIDARLDAADLWTSVAVAITGLPQARCCCSPGRTCPTSRSPPRSTCRSAPCAPGCTALVPGCANSSAMAGNNG